MLQREDPVETVIGRMNGLFPKMIDLSLGRLQALLDRLGHPERRLPPVIHVAGTNGKGSTCAFLRAIGEAAGLRVHVFTSPHLVRWNERVRLAGALVTDAALIAALDHAERVNAGAPTTVFEIFTAAAFLLFAEHPADLLVLEVGLGGRGDSTNVITNPRVAAITSISMDHREMLGDTLAKIAFEKAGIIKPGAPCVTGTQPPEVLAVLRAAAGTRLAARDEAYTITETPEGLAYRDAQGTLALPRPALLGTHQYDNAGIAIAALRLSGLPIAATAYAEGLRRAEWPARMQRLRGALAARLPAGFSLWLDGGHNPGGGQAIAAQLDAWRDQPIYLLVGMKQAKDSAAFLAPLLPRAGRIIAVREPRQHLALPIEAIIAASGGVALPGGTVTEALARVAALPPGRVLICGSLYLAGEVLKQDVN
jgi:dihydrofolate synthase/folylpolyglutamate synthase